MASNVKKRSAGEVFVRDTSRGSISAVDAPIRFADMNLSIVREVPTPGKVAERSRLIQEADDLKVSRCMYLAARGY